MQETQASATGEELAAVAKLQAAYAQIRSELAKVIIGQDAVIEELLIALFCRGHALLVGVPGLAKTLLISTLSRTLGLSFSRIQFTPDLMPSDITGTEVIEEDRATGSRQLRFVRGPVFANVILADEINRTPPKTQSALLEAMQEHQVTAGGKQHRLPQPFFVLATQNPIEQEGTYPLPEAQLDRFMFMIHVTYPSEQEEFDIVRTTTTTRHVDLQHALSAEEIMQLQEVVRSVPAADHVIRYALQLSRLTRREHANCPKFIEEFVSWGAGPRASQYLVLAAKARALLKGRHHVSIEDIRGSGAARAQAPHRHELQCRGRGREERHDRSPPARTRAHAGARATRRQRGGIPEVGIARERGSILSQASQIADYRKYLDPRVLARVAGLDLRARLIVEGLMTGMHRSPYQGISVEFAQHRPYAPGDDIRHVDWKVLAKTDRIYLKQYQEETNLQLVLVVDTSQSMTYGSVGDRDATWSKLDHATAIAATLSYMALGQQDAVGLVVADSELRRFIRPANAPGQWRNVINELSQSSRDRQTQIGRVLDQTAEKLTHRSLVVILSDFFDDLSQVRRGLRHLRHRRHEAVAFQVLDPHEITFPFEDPTRFVGLESAGDLLTDPHALRESYLQQLQNATEKLRKDCRSMQIDFARMNSGDTLDVALSQFLATRAATMR